MGNDITAIPNSPQEKFLASTVREVGFGGQAGGSKSFSLILDALYQIDKHGYNAILFRRTFKQLSGADGLIELSRRVYPKIGGTYLKSEHLWTFSDHPGTIRFAHLEHEDSVTNYEGHQYAYIGWDELQTFYESQYVYMFSRNRSSNPEIRSYTRATFMPGDIGHFWVKKRFIDTKIEYKPKWYRRIDGVDTEVGPDDPYAVQRMFIPAQLEDNPYLYRDGQGDYEKGLYQLNIVDFRRRRKGDWDIRRSGRVYHAFSEKNIVQSGALKLDKAAGFYTAHDFGAVNEAAGIFAKAGKAYILFHEDLFPEGTTSSKAARLRAHLLGRKLVSSVGGSLSEKQQRYDWTQAGFPIRAPFNPDVESQINKVNEMFAAGTLLIASDCVMTIDQLENCTRDENEKIADKSVWHHLDVLRYFAAGLGGGWAR